MHCKPQRLPPIILTVKGDPGIQGPQGIPGEANSPLTTVGDIWVYSQSGNDRLPVGSDGSVLRANSATTYGLDYTGNINPNPNLPAILGQDSGWQTATGTGVTGFGQQALADQTTGSNNTAFGFNTLAALTTTSQSTAVGSNSLSQSTAVGNTALGYNSAANTTTGFDITAIGNSALAANITGNANTAVGNNALQANTASANTAVGAASMRDNTTGFENTALGTSSLQDNVIGFGNVAVGHRALSANDTGATNTIVGAGSMPFGVSANECSSLGTFSLGNNGASNNTGIGFRAGVNNTTGVGNVFLGHQSGANVVAANSSIVIGSIPGLDVSNATFVANIDTSAVVGTPVVVDATGRLGVVVSSKRFKENIEPISDDLSERLMLLCPVKYNYKNDPSKGVHYGLIAEQVYQVIPELVVTKQNTINETIEEKRADGTVHKRNVSVPSGDAEPFTVHYDQIIPLLLNEIIKLRTEVDALIHAVDLP